MLVKSIYIEKLNQNVDFYIGENAEDNTNIVINADDDDLWFHIYDLPSPHILAVVHNILIERKMIDRKAIRSIVVQGSLLCKQNSKYKSEKKVDIIYTKIKNVIPTDKLGSVNTSNTKHIFV